MRMTIEQLQSKMEKNTGLHISSKVWNADLTALWHSTWKSKYGNKKVDWYASKKERNRAFELECLEKAGVIYDFRQQVPFVLQEAYTNNKWEKIRPLKYRADFTYTRDGRKICEDTKGFRTDVFKIKKKIFEYKYPDWHFIES